MIFLGDSLVPYEEVCCILNKEDIYATKAHSTLLFTYDESLMKYCYENNLAYGVKINSLKEGLYANALHAKYIICSQLLSKEMQHIAQNYLFDSKILRGIKSNSELECAARDEIDGVIYESILADDKPL